MFWRSSYWVAICFVAARSPGKLSEEACFGTGGRAVASGAFLGGSACLDADVRLGAAAREGT